MFNQRRHSFLLSATFLLFLSACAKATPLAPTLVSEATPTVNVSTIAPGETSTAPTPVSEATPTDLPKPPTPTAPPLTLIVAARPEIADAVQRAAQEFGWRVEQAAEASPETLRPLAQAGASVIVAEGGDLRALAEEFPNIYFVAVNTSGENWPANVVALGGAGSRFDQLGFLAGMAAGLATETKTVAAITDLSAAGLNYRNGFLHGVRYTCPRCQVQYIDVFDVENGGAQAAQTAALYASISSDVVFAAAGNAGNEALRAAAQEEAWVIGSGGDVYVTVFENGAAPRADKVLTSVRFDAGAAVYQALVQYHAGAPLAGQQPFSAASNAIALAPYRAEALNALDQQDLAAALARLADGSLDTGIDPATGQEK
jgi:basic membrane lipoprotein Med (substrate-binding protein (PBP1-ABC) superfamily)